MGTRHRIPVHSDVAYEVSHLYPFHDSRVFLDCRRCRKSAAYIPIASEKEERKLERRASAQYKACHAAIVFWVA